MLEITPRQYGQSMAWSLLPSNIIRNVVAFPILNTVDAEDVIHSESIKRVTIGEQELTLPISSSVRYTSKRHMVNRISLALGDSATLAKARVDCVIAEGEFEIELSEAISGTPTASVELVGTSKVIDRGKVTYNSYPSIEDMVDSDFSLAQWVDNHSQRTEYDYMQGDYTGKSFSMNPWARKITPYDEGVIYPFENPYPPSDDILTLWGKDMQGYTVATKENWTDVAWGKPERKSMLLPKGVADPVAESSWCIRMYDVHLPINCYLLGGDDAYHYKIRWSAPVRVAYAAAARGRNLLGSYKDVDSYAYVDYVTSINFKLFGRTFNANTVEIAASAGVNGEHTLRLDKSEALSTLSYVETPYRRWLDVFPEQLIEKYKDGKYVVACDVPARWAIENSLNAGTQVYVRLRGGAYISRASGRCVFEIKNIEKIFQGNAFFYSLKLMEV